MVRMGHCTGNIESSYHQICSELLLGFSLILGPLRNLLLQRLAALPVRDFGSVYGWAFPFWSAMH